MTRAEFASRLTLYTPYIERHRPLLMYSHLAMFVVGVSLLVAGIAFDTVYSVPIWGALLYSLPLAFWGAIIAGASLICVIGLVRPPNAAMVLVGSGLHLTQFCAVAVSTIVYGGDLTIGIWSLTFLAFHAKLYFEAARSF